MLMHEREYHKTGLYGSGIFANQKYRYGFNGKENDNDILGASSGEGNMQDYGMRISDVRFGRFLSVDTKA
jgi:hypothetical protein